jgi:hypothetical protein
MQNPKSVSELLRKGGNRLSNLKARAAERLSTLEQVRAALPEKLARSVVSAGIQDGRLTLGVAGAAWASRLRYLTDVLREQVGAASGLVIERVRISVVPPPKPAD